MSVIGCDVDADPWGKEGRRRVESGAGRGRR